MSGIFGDVGLPSLMAKVCPHPWSAWDNVDSILSLAGPSFAQEATDSVGIETSLQKTMAELDQAFAREEPTVCAKVGSTVCLCYLEGSRAHVANVGDSRAVGGRRKPGGYHELVALSCDHNTSNQKEVEAVIKRAGDRDAVRVDPSEKREGTLRVDGCLMVTRALGDTGLKPKFITSVPEVRSMSLSEGDCIVLATDGVWDYLSSQEALHTAVKAWPSRPTKEEEGGAGEGGENAAGAIGRRVLKRVADENHTTMAKLKAMPPGEERSAIVDDISCVVLFFGGAGGGTPGRPAVGLPAPKRVKR